MVTLESVCGCECFDNGADSVVGPERWLIMIPPGERETKCCVLGVQADIAIALLPKPAFLPPKTANLQQATRYVIYIILEIASWIVAVARRDNHDLLVQYPRLCDYARNVYGCDLAGPLFGDAGRAIVPRLAVGIDGLGRWFLVCPKWLADKPA
jgi:hypothetical protein